TQERPPSSSTLRRPIWGDGSAATRPCFEPTAIRRFRTKRHPSPSSQRESRMDLPCDASTRTRERLKLEPIESGPYCDRPSSSTSEQTTKIRLFPPPTTTARSGSKCPSSINGVP